jgi:two-component system, cell cycle sensor histidine kinase and response regulator CckA
MDARQATILVVDDDAGVRSIAEVALSRAGYNVVVASDANQALKTLGTPAPIDLLLTDVVMPDKNGLALAQEAAILRPGLITRFMSGYLVGRLLDAVDGKSIRKPFDLNGLLAGVENALTEKD